MKKILLILILLPLILNSQVGKNQVLMVNASVNNSGATLFWKPNTFTGDYRIFKKSSIESDIWGSAIVILPSTATSYTDTTLKPGMSADYQVISTNGTSALALGYIYVGNKLNERPYKGGIVLMIDSSYEISLKKELFQLKKDMIEEGWTVSTLYVSKNLTAIQTKTKLKQHIAQQINPVSSLLIIGNVAVPYSGGFTGDGSNFPPPDGHIEGSGNHTGAWPADAYYGDLDYDWIDNNITLTTGAQSRHHNIPNDGKFDHVKFPTTLDLEVSRIDLSRMSQFSLSEIELTRNYLNRNHLWRTGKISVLERGLIDDNFTTLNLSSTAWHNFSTFFPIDSVINTKDYFTELRTNSYLWSYGCGPGSYTTCGGIGSTNDFVNDTQKHIFTMLAGSFFGDFDIANNFLKAPLCKSALASFWGGIPKWYVHGMAMGLNIGHGTKVSMNNNTVYFNGNFNGAWQGVHMALMGDLTLCNRHIAPVETLICQELTPTSVKLTWTKPKGNYDGFIVYYVDRWKNTYNRLNANIITDTTFTVTGIPSGEFFQVRPVKLETTASGSYYNLGAGPYATINGVLSNERKTITNWQIYPNPSSGIYNFKNIDINSVKLTNIYGQQINVEINKEQNNIDISYLPAGIYIITFIQNNLPISTTIIKN